jgi:hypothetical protein
MAYPTKPLCRDFKIFGRKIAFSGWSSVYTGTGFLKGKGFDVLVKTLEIGWPRRSVRWRPFVSFVTDIYIRT